MAPNGSLLTRVSLPTAVLGVIGGLVLPYVAVGLLLSIPTFQSGAIYMHKFKTTPKGDLNHPEKFGFEQGQVTPLQIATRDGVLLHAWHVLPHAVYLEHQENLIQRNTPNLDVQRTPSLCLLRDDPEARLVLHFHGSSGSVASSWRVDSYRALSSEASSRIHMLTFDYRGFGLSEGMPTEEGLITDAESVFDWAVDVAGIPPERIVIFGHSMGSGVSIALTQKLMDRGIYTAGLVAVAGFVDVTTIARTYKFRGYPVFRPLQLVPGLVEFLTSKLSSTWRNADRLADIVGRSDRYHVEIVHAQDDAIVPYQNAVELFQRAFTASRADTETNLEESDNSEEGIVRSMHTNKGTITLTIPQSGDHDKIVMGPAFISAVLRTLHGTSS
ncbi:abhydrolase domain-containing protein [Seiridium cupressi]